MKIKQYFIGVVVTIIFIVIARCIFSEINGDGNKVLVTFILGGVCTAFLTSLTIGVNPPPLKGRA